MPIKPHQAWLFVIPAATFILSLALIYLLSSIFAGAEKPDVLAPVFVSMLATLTFFTLSCESSINNNKKTIDITWTYLGFHKSYQLCTFDEVFSVAGSGYKTDKKPPRDWKYAVHIIYGKGQICRITDPSSDGLSGAKTLAKSLAEHLGTNFHSGELRTKVSASYDSNTGEISLTNNHNPTDVVFVTVAAVCLGILLLLKIL
mgnify:FL=1